MLVKPRTAVFLDGENFSCDYFDKNPSVLFHWAEAKNETLFFRAIINVRKISSVNSPKKVQKKGRSRKKWKNLNKKRKFN